MDIVDIDQVVLRCLVTLLDVEMCDEFKGAEVIIVEFI